MLLYRLTSTSKNSRMLIAVLLAIAFHAGLLQIEFPSGPIHMPSVSLPRSVNILLRQSPLPRSPVQENNQEEKKNIREKDILEESQPLLPLTEEPLPVKRGSKTNVEPQAVIKTEVPKQPAIARSLNKAVPEEAIVPEFLSGQKDSAGMNPAEDSPAGTKYPQTTVESPKAEKGEGAAAQGALQMAYPRYQLNRPPPYPFLARKRSQQGTVILLVLVNGDGRVDDLEVAASSGFSILDRAAVAAVREWIFEPGKRGDEVVSMRVRVPVTFKLKN